jgi:hypothetical protein
MLDSVRNGDGGTGVVSVTQRCSTVCLSSTANSEGLSTYYRRRSVEGRKSRSARVVPARKVRLTNGRLARGRRDSGTGRQEEAVGRVRRRDEVNSSMHATRRDSRRGSLQSSFTAATILP